MSKHTPSVPDTLGAGPQLFLLMTDPKARYYAPGEKLERCRELLSRQEAAWGVSLLAFIYIGFMYSVAYLALAGIALLMIEACMNRTNELKALGVEHRKLQDHYKSMVNERNTDLPAGEWKTINDRFANLSRQVLRDTVRTVSPWGKYSVTAMIAVVSMVILTLVIDGVFVDPTTINVIDVMHFLIGIILAIGAAIIAAKGAYQERAEITQLQALGNVYVSIPGNLTIPLSATPVKQRNSVVGFYGEPDTPGGMPLFLNNEYDNEDGISDFIRHNTDREWLKEQGILTD